MPQWTSKSPGALVGINAEFWPHPRDSDPGGPQTTPGETPLPAGLEQGPRETEVFVLRLPHQGFEATNRHFPEEAPSFQVGRRGAGGAPGSTASTWRNHGGTLPQNHGGAFLKKDQWGPWN